jgi:hypothetical protein
MSEPEPTAQTHFDFSGVPASYDTITLHLPIGWQDAVSAWLGERGMELVPLPAELGGGEGEYFAGLKR